MSLLEQHQLPATRRHFLGRSAGAVGLAALPWSSTSSAAACSTTPSSSGPANSTAPSMARGGVQANYGRDHHGRCFSVWLAGGGIKPGIVWGATDDYGYNITDSPVPVHDLNATILHCPGIDHERLTFRFQGR